MSHPFRAIVLDFDGLIVETEQPQPHEAFAIEDSPNGVTAAKMAGMRCEREQIKRTNQSSEEKAMETIKRRKAHRRKLTAGST